MRILFDINHPADAHQFKNAIKQMKNEGHKILIIARNKDCTHELLRSENIDFIPRKGYKGLMKIPGVFIIDFMMLKYASKFTPDVMVGSSGDLYIAQVAKLIGKPSVIFDDTEHATFQNRLTFPFATIIATPKSFNLSLGEKQLSYDGFKELAYLHPKYFKPDPSVLKIAALKTNEKFIFLRLVSWEASHDLGTHGINNIPEFAEGLANKYKILISSEGKIPLHLKKYAIKCPPHKIHSLLYYASAVVSEGATMASEAAFLGTPAICINNLPMGCIDALGKAGLVTQTTDLDTVSAKIHYFMENKHAKIQQRKKASVFICQKIDVTKFIIGLIKNSASGITDKYGATDTPGLIKRFKSSNK